MYGLTEPEARRLTESDWWENEDYLYAFDLFNAGYFWEAHSYWERLWYLLETEEAVRLLLRGLIQLAAARLKREQKQPEGSRKLLDRARRAFEELERLRGEESYLGVHLDKALLSSELSVDRPRAILRKKDPEGDDQSAHSRRGR
jgi:hypothetical protein